ncbi:hypothetical protein HHI36_020113 [Cryptolaemus montrouzieri]|uniref:Uncharacterized protein n=1 Tax=Cryptolaemus montrouzieri TaxID=559131 RepID=A0ABD2N997_9CUCU
MGLRFTTPEIGAAEDDLGEVVVDDSDNNPDYICSDNSSYDDTSDDDLSNEAFLANIARRRHSQLHPVFNSDIPSQIAVPYLGKNDMEWHLYASSTGVRVAAAKII